MNRLLNIERALESYGYFCELHRKSEELPEDILIVDLGSDDWGNERRLSIRVSDQLVNPKDNDQDREYFIQFFTTVPVTFEQKHAAELARLLLLFNKGFDFGGFGLSEHDGLIYYKYNMHSPKRMLQTRMLVAVVGLILMALDSLTPQIQAVASGQMSVREVMEATLSLEMPPPEETT